jgi:hypothetical protein
VTLWARVCRCFSTSTATPSRPFSTPSISGVPKMALQAQNSLVCNGEETECNVNVRFVFSSLCHSHFHVSSACMFRNSLSLSLSLSARFFECMGAFSCVPVRACACVHFHACLCVRARSSCVHARYVRVSMHTCTHKSVHTRTHVVRISSQKLLKTLPRGPYISYTYLRTHMYGYIHTCAHI